jgi:formamidopyrimidine-DNA glycosylase
MPELPEVETLCRQLKKKIVGRCVSKVDVLDDKLGVIAGLEGSSVLSVCRNGKEIAIELDCGLAIRVHLRMTGRLQWHDHDDEKAHHTRLVITFDMGRIDLIDPRRFATVKVGNVPLCDVCITNPLESFDVANLMEVAGCRKLPVKSFLMDQKVISGIGNIYACEILYEAGIDPCSRTDRLKKSQWLRIAAAAKSILKKAVECRGTSVSDWRDLFGREADFQNHLQVYAREGESCPRCKGEIKREKIGGRGTYYCPSCQK